MNERTKELIMECVDFRLDPDSNAYEAQVCPEELECLVELVVRECANELIKWKDEPFPYDPGFGAILIKSLFGVK